MSRLPPGYRWISDLSEAAPLLKTGAVPVLRPAQPERAARWTAVLHTYPAPGPRRYGPREARVASLPGHQDLGELVALALGRPHHALDPAALEDPDTLGPDGGSVLVVTRAHALTIDILMPLLDALARQNTLAGFLTGRDDAALTFATAKLLARRPATSAPARTALLDGTTGLAHVLTTGHPDQRSTITDVLARSWDSLLVDADGSAAHACLGAVTLCGLSGPTEQHLANHTVLPGGCTPAACKTDPSGRTRPVAPHDLPTRVLGLFVCNAITLAGEQYPSDVNLALDAVDGHPQAVLGLLRGDLNTSGHQPRLTAESLHCGAQLGQVVARLDTDGHRRGIRGPSTILIGDPEQQLHSPGNAATPPALPCIVAASTPADAQALCRWRARLADAEALEHGLRISLYRHPDTDLATCLEQMTSHRQTALDVLLAAVDTPDEAWQDRIWEQSLRWGQSVLEILNRTRSGAISRQFTAARAHHRTTAWSPAPACGYCRAPREYEHLTSPLGLTDRRTLRCAKCGPALSHPPTLPHLTIQAPTALYRGQPADIHITLPASAKGQFAVHLRPRSTGHGSYDHTVLTATPGRRTVTLTVPSDTVPELDRLWIVHTDSFQVAYHQHRVPLLHRDGTAHP